MVFFIPNIQTIARTKKRPLAFCCNRVCKGRPKIRKIQNALSTKTSVNGLKYFPKGKDLTNIPDEYIQKAFDQLNRRHRKCPGHKIPCEVYDSKPWHWLGHSPNKKSPLQSTGKGQKPISQHRLYSGHCARRHALNRRTQRQPYFIDWMPLFMIIFLIQGVNITLCLITLVNSFNFKERAFFL